MHRLVNCRSLQSLEAPASFKLFGADAQFVQLHNDASARFMLSLKAPATSGLTGADILLSQVAQDNFVLSRIFADSFGTPFP